MKLDLQNRNSVMDNEMTKVILLEKEKVFKYVWKWFALNQYGTLF